MRRRAILGAGVLALYVVLATVSGHLSPLARGPILDGLGPAQPYRWVTPPPSLASTNQPPAVGTFVARFIDQKIRGQVFVSSDGQATVIVPNGAFPPRPGDDAVVLTLTPVDPSTLGPLPAGNEPFGNAYHLTAAYRPSGQAAPDPAAPIDLVLLYPVTPDLNSATHTVFASADGKAWRVLHGSDAPSVQQTEGKTNTLGYAVVGGVAAPGPHPSTAPGTTGSGSGSNAIRTLLLVIALSVLLVGVALLIRSRGSGEDHGGHEDTGGGD